MFTNFLTTWMETWNFLPDVVALYPQKLAPTNPMNTLNLNELTMVKFWALSLEKLFKSFQQQEN